jgi:hypothetical protein
VPAGIAPALSGGEIRPNPANVGARVSLTVDFIDPDADVDNGTLEVAFTAALRVTAEGPITNPPGGTEGTVSAALVLPVTLGAGAYQVEVTLRDAAGRSSNVVRIPLQVSADPCFAEAQTEPNAEPARAVAIDLGTPYPACIENSRDEDLYLVRTPEMPAAGGYAVISVKSGEGTGLSPEFTVEDDAGVTLTAPVSGGAAQDVKGWVVLAAGSFSLVRLGARSGPDDLNAPYTLTVTLRTVRDTNEPDNDFAHARPLTLSSLHTTSYLFHGAGHPESLPDFYRFDAGAGEVRVQIPSVPSTIALHVRLYDGPREEDRVAEWVQFEPNPSEDFVRTQQVTGGVYYLEVSAFNDLQEIGGVGDQPPAHLREPYHLRVSLR